jgi:hypothetical protein
MLRSLVAWNGMAVSVTRVETPKPAGVDIQTNPSHRKTLGPPSVRHDRSASEMDLEMESV